MGFLDNLLGKKKKDPAPAPEGNKTGAPKGSGGGNEEKKDHTGGFLGFVLLKEAGWDKKAIFRTLKEEWGIVPDDKGEDPAEEKDENAAVFWVNGTMCAYSLMPAPVPGGEAERFAAANYFWKEAVEVTKTHTAHLLVSVMGSAKDPVGAAKLFTALAAGALEQPGVLGIYTSGTVFQPDFYLKVASDMKNGDLPVMDWVYIGLYRGKKGACGYTYGLASFGREEMEILESAHAPGEIMEFLYDLCIYLLKSGNLIREGETVGRSAEEKLPVTRSKGEALDGMTLKIAF